MKKELGAFDWFLAAFKPYANFNGRTQRRGYWYFYLFYLIIGVVCNVIDIFVAPILGFPIFTVVFLLGAIIPFLAVSIRRLHDIGKSGWWLLLIFVPFGAIVLIVWYATVSTPQDNQYGPYVE
ncbi:DUF805 domain-containing protein [Ignatzschineria sp. LJL83]